MTEGHFILFYPFEFNCALHNHTWARSKKFYPQGVPKKLFGLSGGVFRLSLLTSWEIRSKPSALKNLLFCFVFFCGKPMTVNIRLSFAEEQIMTRAPTPFPLLALLAICKWPWNGLQFHVVHRGALKFSRNSRKTGRKTFVHGQHPVSLA